MFNHLKWKLIYAHKILLSQNDIFRLKMTNFRSKISISKKSTKIHSRPEFSDFFSNWVCIQLSNIACGISNIHKLLWTDIISYNIIFRQDLKKDSSIKFTSSFIRWYVGQSESRINGQAETFWLLPLHNMYFYWNWSFLD